MGQIKFRVVEMSDGSKTVERELLDDTGKLLAWLPITHRLVGTDDDVQVTMYRYLTTGFVTREFTLEDVPRKPENDIIE